MSRYDALVRHILQTVDDWAEDADRNAHLPSCRADAHLRAGIADLLEQELQESPEVALLERLAQVYTVDTDQVALIALVDEARLAVRQ